MAVFRLDPVIQHYAWGSKDAIARLLGRAASGQPEAEMWMGAHPKGPSRLVEKTAGASDLQRLIASDPSKYLGRQLSELPFLFKVLAAATPLSLQAHPNLQQAQEGFQQEERAGLDLGAVERNYKDPNHKPELIYALSDFSAWSGFRRADEARSVLSSFDCDGPPGLVEPLRQLAEGEIEPIFRALFALSVSERQDLIERVSRRALVLAEEENELGRVASRIASLARKYPDDPGVIAALLLNFVELKPGQAMFLPAGNLHAYLEGVGLEVMANSDNVLRGGLTPKHVDAAELCRVLRFEALVPEIIEGTSAGQASSTVYRTPAREFELSILQIDASSATVAGPALALVLQGEFWAAESPWLQGACGFISAEKPEEWKGTGTMAVVTLPDEG